MKKFEYKILTTGVKGFCNPTIDGEELSIYFDKLGSLGWELVSSVGTNYRYGRTNEIVFIFKREIIIQ